MADQRRAPSPTTGLHGPLHPARATYDAKTTASQDAFLKAFGQCGSIAQAAAAAGIHPATVRDLWVKNDALGFQARFHNAQAEFADYLEQLALKRVENPTNNGRTGSDVLLMGLLNANHPTKWRHNVQVTHELGTRVVDTLRQLQAQDRAAGTLGWQPELPPGRVLQGEKAAEAPEEGLGDEKGA